MYVTKGLDKEEMNMLSYFSINLSLVALKRTARIYEVRKPNKSKTEIVKNRMFLKPAILECEVNLTSTVAFSVHTFVKFMFKLSSAPRLVVTETLPLSALMSPL